MPHFYTGPTYTGQASLTLAQAHETFPMLEWLSIRTLDAPDQLPCGATTRFDSTAHACGYFISQKIVRRPG